MTSEIRKWEYKYTEYLNNKLQTDVQDIRAFITEATHGMRASIAKEFYTKLLVCCLFFTVVLRSFCCACV